MDKLGRKYRDEDNIANDINIRRRGFFIDKVKKPMMMAFKKVITSNSKVALFFALFEILRLAMSFSNPTQGNTRKKNTKLMLCIWDEFFRNETHLGRIPLFMAIKRLSIGMYEHSSYYTERLDWFIGRICQQEWNHLRPWNPSEYWDEPSVLDSRRQRIKELMAGIEEKTGESIGKERVL